MAAGFLFGLVNFLIKNPAEKSKQAALNIALAQVPCNSFITKNYIMSNEAINLKAQELNSRQTFHPAGSKKGNSHRGFAAMTPEQQRQIASKGGEAVSRNRGHMAEIGKKGGEIVSQNRKHMSEIGRKGGEASKASRNRA